MDLNTMFPNGKTYATYGNAQRKVDAFAKTLPADATGFHTVIINMGTEAGKDRFQPIAILGRECRIPALWFIDAGLCVTNV